MDLNKLYTKKIETTEDFEQARNKINQAYENKLVDYNEWMDLSSELISKHGHLISNEEVDDNVEQVNNIKEELFTIPENKTKKDVLDDIIIKGNDLDYFVNPILIPSHIVNRLIKEEQSQSAYFVLVCLAKHCNSQGEVFGIRTTQIAKWCGYKEDSTARYGLNKLEENEFITIDRSNRTNSYKINDYVFKGLRGVVVPEDIMKNQAKNTTTKQLRGMFYYMLRNHHSPRNTEGKWDLTMSTLKSKIKAGSYIEVNNVLNSLKGRFFSAVETVSKKFKVAFDKIKLGIVEDDIERKMILSANPQVTDKIKDIFKSIKIDLTYSNLQRAINWCLEYAESNLITVFNNRYKVDKSNKGSVWYFKHLLDRARSGSLLP